MRDWKMFNGEIVAEFRANAGRVPRFGEMPVLILHTIGARTGEIRETPLIPVFEGGEVYVFATAEGSTTHPSWYHNLRAHPRITIEAAGDQFIADVVQIPEDEAARIVGERAANVPQLAEYVAKAAPRKVPVFVVKRV